MQNKRNAKMMKSTLNGVMLKNKWKDMTIEVPYAWSMSSATSHDHNGQNKIFKKKTKFIKSR